MDVEDVAPVDRGGLDGPRDEPDGTRERFAARSRRPRDRHDAAGHHARRCSTHVASDARRVWEPRSHRDGDPRCSRGELRVLGRQRASLASRSSAHGDGGHDDAVGSDERGDVLIRRGRCGTIEPRDLSIGGCGRHGGRRARQRDVDHAAGPQRACVRVWPARQALCVSAAARERHERDAVADDVRRSCARDDAAGESARRRLRLRLRPRPVAERDLARDRGRLAAVGDLRLRRRAGRAADRDAHAERGRRVRLRQGGPARGARRRSPLAAPSSGASSRYCDIRIIPPRAARRRPRGRPGLEPGRIGPTTMRAQAVARGCR